MIEVKIGRQIISDLIKYNNFPRQMLPLITVLRQTTVLESGQMVFCKDNGKNICDTILLHGKDNTTYDDTTYAVKGRSTPHEKYQKKMVDKIARANYIATGAYSSALRKGHHRGKEALVQNKSYLIYRSKDMELRDEDDYIDYNGFVGDNFHGNAPFSAGCITVEGNMFMGKNKKEIRSGDWKFTHNWIYNICKHFTFFSVIILDYADTFIFREKDIEDDRDNLRLRFGSVGREVIKLQEYLGLKTDGDFGPMTFQALRKKQIEIELDDTGIYDFDTRKILERKKYKEK